MRRRLLPAVVVTLALLLTAGLVDVQRARRKSAAEAKQETKSVHFQGRREEGRRDVDVA